MLLRCFYHYLSKSVLTLLSSAEDDDDADNDDGRVSSKGPGLAVASPMHSERRARSEIAAHRDCQTCLRGREEGGGEHRKRGREIERGRARLPAGKLLATSLKLLLRVRKIFIPETPA